MTQNAIDSAALAAWESATVLNLNPVLADAASTQLWDAILAHRDAGDLAAFATAARAIAETATPNARVRLETAIDSLTALHTATTVVPAGAPATE